MEGTAAPHAHQRRPCLHVACAGASCEGHLVPNVSLEELLGVEKVVVARIGGDSCRFLGRYSGHGPAPPLVGRHSDVAFHPKASVADSHHLVELLTQVELAGANLRGECVRDTEYVASEAVGRLAKHRWCGGSTFFLVGMLHVLPFLHTSLQTANSQAMPANGGARHKCECAQAGSQRWIADLTNLGGLAWLGNTKTNAVAARLWRQNARV